MAHMAALRVITVPTIRDQDQGVDMPEASPIAGLLAAAARADQSAWDEIVERYSPMLVSVVSRFRLNPAQVDDIAQTVWLRLVEHLGSLREPEALPGWIATTARRESLRVLANERRSSPMSAVTEAGLVSDQPSPDEELLRSERHEALLAGLAELPARMRELLLMLIQDPPLTYAEITERTGMPVGSVGPTRARALERLRATEPMQRFMAGAAGARKLERESR
jgi:RNA polymerase sigma factor (sigma-70 family)